VNLLVSSSLFQTQRGRQELLSSAGLQMVAPQIDFEGQPSIQHSAGTAKKIAIRNNLVTASTPTELRYFTHTKQGSSGSPVLEFNLHGRFCRRSAFPPGQSHHHCF